MKELRSNANVYSIGSFNVESRFVQEGISINSTGYHSPVRFKEQDRPPKYVPPQDYPKFSNFHNDIFIKCTAPM